MKTEYRSILWGSLVWYGAKIERHDSLEDAITRIEKMAPPLRQELNDGALDFYTISSNEMVATVRCYIVKTTAT